MNEQYLTSTAFAKRIGVSIQTVRLWDRRGVLRPHHKSPSGVRYYSESQVRDYLRSPDGVNANMNEAIAASVVLSSEDVPDEVSTPLMSEDEAVPEPAAPQSAARRLRTNPRTLVTVNATTLARLIRSGIAAVQSGATPEAFAETVLAHPGLIDGV